MGQRCSRAKLMAISRTGFTERLPQKGKVGQLLLREKSLLAIYAGD